jgi:hypothetical protein
LSVLFAHAAPGCTLLYERQGGSAMIDAELRLVSKFRQIQIWFGERLGFDQAGPTTPHRDTLLHALAFDAVRIWAAAIDENPNLQPESPLQHLLAQYDAIEAELFDGPSAKLDPTKKGNRRDG